MTTISLLTLNAWGLKYVSRHRRARLQAIAERLATAEDEHYTIVALQEVWTEEDWDEISSQCASRFPYRRWFKSGIVAGPGLAILSKYPIKSTFLYRFPVNGRPSAFWRGDWYVGKSIAVTILDIDGHSVAILNSHLHAPYSLSGDAKYECHRTIQTWDFSRIIQTLKDAGHSVIVVGDMNSRKGELSYELLTNCVGLVDSWEEIHEPVDLQVIKSMNPIDQIYIAGATCDSILNTWRSSREPWEACRLDYALIDKIKFQVLSSKVVFTEQIPGIGSYSDHFGYSVQLKLNKESSLSTKVSESVDQSSKFKSQKITNEISIYKEVLSLIKIYNNTSKWQKLWRTSHFFISIILLIGITVMSAFTSAIAPWSSVFCVLGAILITSTGLIDGLIGYLFGNYELRSLKEAEEELIDAITWLEYSKST